MPKPFKSAWDFGQSSPPRPPTARQVLSVSELTWQIRRLLESQVGQVWVTGEISNYKPNPSGHIYFSLKDAGAELKCVLFRGELQVERSILQDGRKVTLQGELTVYEPRGQYQLRVTRAELEGVGALQAAFEKLKQKLNAEGLFAPERKRPLPRYPQRIGIVTSPTGAAIQDVLHVIERRQPGLEIILAPCRVQGEGAAAEIAEAIRLLNELNAQRSGGRKPARIEGELDLFAAVPVSAGPFLDLILVTRGGGSLEDLWAFNEEVVARAVFNSALPVVSAVGHEIDFTISDFVADARAATPSAAAEIITEGVYASSQFLFEARDRLGFLVRRQLEDKRMSWEQAGQRLQRLHPRRRLEERQQRLDDLQASLSRCVRQGARHQRQAWRALADRLARVRPALLLAQRREWLAQRAQRLREQARHRLEHLRNRFATTQARLRLLGPEQVLARGYSITMDAATGRVVRHAAEVKPGQRLRSRLGIGEIRSRVEDGG
jgi:exodeoxyribonuclease VII large subunit